MTKVTQSVLKPFDGFQRSTPGSLWFVSCHRYFSPPGISGMHIYSYQMSTVVESAADVCPFQRCTCNSRAQCREILMLSTKEMVKDIIPGKHAANAM